MRLVQCVRAGLLLSSKHPVALRTPFAYISHLPTPLEDAMPNKPKIKTAKPDHARSATGSQFPVHRYERAARYKRDSAH